MAVLNPRLTPPTKASADNQWISWYEEVLSFFGKKDAQSEFTKAWNLRGSTAANTGTLRDYFNKQGISISANSIVGTVRDEATGAFDTVGSFFKIGGAIGMAIGVTIFIVIIIVVLRLATPQTAGAVTKAALI